MIVFVVIVVLLVWWLLMISLCCLWLIGIIVLIDIRLVWSGLYIEWCEIILGVGDLIKCILFVLILLCLLIGWVNVFIICFKNVFFIGICVILLVVFIELFFWIVRLLFINIVFMLFVLRLRVILIVLFWNLSNLLDIIFFKL